MRKEFPEQHVIVQSSDNIEIVDVEDLKLPDYNERIAYPQYYQNLLDLEMDEVK